MAQKQKKTGAAVKPIVGALDGSQSLKTAVGHRPRVIRPLTEIHLLESTVPERLDKPKQPHSFKLDPDLFEAINEMAGRDNRSVNNLVETILWKELRATQN